MANQTVEVIGLKEAVRALRRLPGVAADESQTVMNVTAFQVSRSASSLAPRSADGSHGHAPGFLASAIRWKAGRLSAVVGILRAAFYWRFVEYGTRKMAAQPFLRPAADSFRHDHRERLVAAMARAASRIARGAR